MDDSLRAAGIIRRIGLRVPHFTVVPQILQRTDWMVTLPQRVADVFNQSGQFVVYPLPVAIPHVEVTIHWHESYENDAGARWLRELIVETLREP